MKTTLSFEFDLPEETQAYKEMTLASEAHRIIDYTREEIFRPARKHGYEDTKLQNLSDRDCEVIGILEDKFIAALRELGLIY